MEMKLSEQLESKGFHITDIMWSFEPRMYWADRGRYYSKYVEIGKDSDGYIKEIEIGVIINEEYNTMEVYMCDCVVGCCGQDLGVHPFSTDKIDELYKEFLIEYNKQG